MKDEALAQVLRYTIVPDDIPLAYREVRPEGQVSANMASVKYFIDFQGEPIWASLRRDDVEPFVQNFILGYRTAQSVASYESAKAATSEGNRLSAKGAKAGEV